jgi:hypothetical protein
MNGGVEMTTDLLTRLPDLEREAEEFERKARALRQIIEGVRTLNGEAARLLDAPATANGATPAAGGLRGRALVRHIVAERSGVWTVKEIKRVGRARGYVISDSGVEKAVMRMAETGEAERTGYGTYDFSGTREVT